MIRVGIIGGAGYVAGELLRLLVHHPEANVVFIQSNSQEGKQVKDIHQDLIGEPELVFINDLQNHPEVDLLFLCGGHGQSKVFLSKYNLPDQVRIIDMSRDFRIEPEKNGYVYGLPELYKSEIFTAKKVANPGCFATCIQLGLLPMANSHSIENDVHIHALTGSTGAGAIPSGTTHFSWRNSNISIYKAFRHQHMDEVFQSLNYLQPDLEKEVNFLPVRGNFTRGIYASMYCKMDKSGDEILEEYQDFYKEHPFTHVTSDHVHLKQVVNTNKCIIQVQKIDNKVLIISMIDNLLKGASGQAVQNMNLMFGLLEKAGLDLKSSAF